jgi:adenylosuccinate lyase
VLLALTQKGVSREDSYAWVQRNAMPVWGQLQRGASGGGEGDFQALLGKDRDVAKVLSPAELESLFDLAYHLKHVDTIFRRVFGA